MLSRLTTRLLAGALVLAVLAAPVYAQDRDRRIAELEQEAQALKAAPASGDATVARITALEAAVAGLKADPTATGATAARITALEAEVAALRAQAAPAPATPAQPEPPPAGVQGAPNPLQDDKKYLTGQDLLDDAFPNSIPIPGTDVRFAIGGYAKLDFIVDLDYVGDRFEFELATIPVAGTPAAAYGGRTNLHAKETRFNFDFRSQAVSPRTGRAYPLQAFIELDFFEDREDLSRQPRLRHAYGVIGNFLAGQTWTISGDLEALAGTIDFSGGDALYGDRAAQLRWQARASDHVTWAAGVEDPKSDIGNPLEVAGLSRSRLPNFAGRVRWTSTGGSHVQVGGDLFRLDWQGGDAGPSDTAVGFGLNLTGRWLLAEGRKDAVIGGGTIGRGSAHRVIPLEGGGNDAIITEAGLDVMSHWQAYVGYSHYWTPSLNSTIETNWAELDNSEFQPASAIHRVGSMHVNLIWFPYRLAATGVEVMWGERLNKDGARGRAWRVQYMVKYKFN